MAWFGGSRRYVLTVRNETGNIALISLLMREAHTPRKHTICIDPKVTGDVRDLKRQPTIMLINCGNLGIALDLDKDQFSSSHQIIIKDSEVHFDDAQYNSLSHPITILEKKLSDEMVTDHEYTVPAGSPSKGNKVKGGGQGMKPTVSVSSMDRGPPASLASPTDKLLARAEAICYGNNKKTDPSGFEIIQNIPSYMVVRQELVMEFGEEAFQKNKANVRLLLEKLHVRQLPRSVDLVQIKTKLPTQNSSVIPAPNIVVLTAQQIDMQFGISFDDERKFLNEEKARMEQEKRDNVVKAQRTEQANRAAAAAKRAKDEQAERDRLNRIKERQEKDRQDAIAAAAAKEQREQEEQARRDAEERERKIKAHADEIGRKARIKREAEEREQKQQAEHTAKVDEVETILKKKGYSNYSRTRIEVLLGVVGGNVQQAVSMLT